MSLLPNLTRNGLARFGRFVEAARKSPEAKTAISRWLRESHPEIEVGDEITREQFALWLTAIVTPYEKPFSESAIGRLERGVNLRPPIDLLNALVGSQLLRLPPEGKPCTFNDVIGIMTESIDPFTGRRREIANEFDPFS